MELCFLVSIGLLVDSRISRGAHKYAQTLIIIRTEWKNGSETWIKCELHYYLFDSTRLNLLILIFTTIL